MRSFTSLIAGLSVALCGTAIKSSAAEVSWVDDALPAGAVSGSDGGDTWNWVTSNPTAFSGVTCNQSAIAAGLHQHYFSSASSGLPVAAGETLFAYVYLDPNNLPREIMLQWSDGSWDHRAYWGANLIAYGTQGTASRRYMGPLPTAGQWVRLEVPAGQVNLENSTVTGMAFSAFDGRASWDYAGKATVPDNPDPGTNSAPVNGEVWIDDALPTGAFSGAEGGDSWSWVNSNPSPVSGWLAHQSGNGFGLHQHHFWGATRTLTLTADDTLFTYVYLDPANPPSEIMLQWNDGSWDHRAYWGADRIDYGISGTASRRYMGPLPSAGQWVRLEVPATNVNLAGRTLNGMAFGVFDGRATWDAAGKNSPTVTTNSPSTNSPPPTTNSPPTSATSPSELSVIDYTTLAIPPVGANALCIVTPSLIELRLINTKEANQPNVSQWNFVDGNFQLSAPPASAFAVTVNGQPVAVTDVGFRRRPLYAPFEMYDLRIENSIYLQLATPVADGQTVEVKNPAGTLWSANTLFATTVDPLRYSPAIHVNQEGYMPGYSKKAMVGQYLGSLGELNFSTSAGFRLIDARTGATVYQGALTHRPDSGWGYAPMPYQQVYEADFTAFNTPGQYRLMVPGLGASLSFVIDGGIAMNFARAYQLGLYHQRCGTNTAMPHTRFTHDPCHLAPASVPMPASSFGFTWTTIANYAQIHNPDNPPQSAPTMNANSQLFPFVSQGAVDTSGGHHDAGDYSKYTCNSANLIHYLMFAVDSLPGVADLDNLGIPESGDGISDVLQEAKWEADYLAKVQDSDGGFYFLIYPVNREYEGWVTPENGDPQVVWPKTTSATAAAVAALAQCASSPAFKQAYPEAAAQYLQKAQLGWQFLLNAVSNYGKTGAYQKITHYGDVFTDQDELAWAAAEMYLATGDQSIHQTLLSWFNPSDPATIQYGWHHLTECYGHAIRSYAFGARSGRLAASALDATFHSKCDTQILAAGDANLRWSEMSAYGTSFPEPTKRILAAGWYFSTDQAFDIAVAYQLNAKSDYMTAMVANMNYEGGCNPVNVSYVTGMGWKRQCDIVSQWHSVTPTRLPPSGIPVGNVTAVFAYSLTYGTTLNSLCYPSDLAVTAPYPFYDRWGDSWNVMAEMVVLNQARSLATLSFLAAQTSLKTQAWRSVAGQIAAPSATVAVGTPLTFTLQAPGVDLSNARIVWEGTDQQPTFAAQLVFTPKRNGAQWVEAEAHLPDGRRVFAKAAFNADSPNTVWTDDAVPAGAVTGGEGGDSWNNWVSNNPIPSSGTQAHQSALSSGFHQHYFDNATTTLSVGTGDVLYAYVYLDPVNPPTEVMLQWNDGTWLHRAYWGADQIAFGVNGTASRRYMGPLPSTGRWVRLEVPANKVNLEGRVVKGMAFSLFNGRATWDAAGRMTQGSGTPTQITVPGVSLKVVNGYPIVTWPSTAGSTYRVAYKNDLRDASWTTASVDITATGTSALWVDTTPSRPSRRFYVVTRVQ